MQIAFGGGGMSSETAEELTSHLKPHERFFILNYRFYRTEPFPGRKGIPHNPVDLCYMCIRTLEKGEACS
jgi:hypothetical protein